MKTLLFAGAAALACLSLSACGTTGLSLTPGANSGAFLADLDKFNQAAGQNCSGSGNIDWNPPLPPTGSLHVQCAIGTNNQVVKMSDLQALVKSATTATPPSDE
jgi:hypothetical protein